MNTGVLCSKEMVDLLMNIKRHMKASYNIQVSMSDNDVLTKLLSFKHIDDDLLQGKLQYLMAMAGGDWSQEYARKEQQSARATGAVQALTRKVKESMANREASAAVHNQENGGTRVRYYRGQPVYS